MGILSLLGTLSPIHIYFVRLTTGARRVGRDGLGNAYFEVKARRGYTHPRRFVLYKGAPDPSSVPPEWHGWLHHQTDTVPSNTEPSFRRSWQKPPRANMTGTDQAYLPPGHVARGGVRSPSTGDYQAWTPDRTDPPSSLDRKTSL